jgi:methionyl-tRNA formyltransferase
MPVTNLKVIPFAYQDIGFVCLKELIRMKLDIPFVVTHRDDHREKIWFRSVRDLAKKNRIPFYYSEDLSRERLKSLVEKARPDLIASLYYRRMLPEDIFSIPRFGSINLHGSFLPYYRGRCPVNWVLVMGEKETGLTFHFMVKRPDAGDMIKRIRIPIKKTDTAIDIYKKMTVRAPLLLNNVIKEFLSGSVKRIRQDESMATYFGGRRPEDGKIDWSMPAEEIYNLVRAVTHPYPGAFGFLNEGRKICVWKAKVVKDKRLLKKTARFSPGQVIGNSKRYGIMIKTGKGVLGCVDTQI